LPAPYLSRLELERNYLLSSSANSAEIADLKLRALNSETEIAQLKAALGVTNQTTKSLVASLSSVQLKIATLPRNSRPPYDDAKKRLQIKNNVLLHGLEENSSEIPLDLIKSFLSDIGYSNFQKISPIAKRIGNPKRIFKTIRAIRFSFVDFADKCDFINSFVNSQPPAKICRASGEPYLTDHLTNEQLLEKRRSEAQIVSKSNELQSSTQSEQQEISSDVEIVSQDSAATDPSEVSTSLTSSNAMLERTPLIPDWNGIDAIGYSSQRKLGRKAKRNENGETENQVSNTSKERKIQKAPSKKITQ
jgi:hypothetical protein